MERARPDVEDLEVGAARPAAGNEPSPIKDDEFLSVRELGKYLLVFVLGVICLVVASAVAALWVLSRVDFAFVWLILGALGLGVALLSFSALR